MPRVSKKLSTTSKRSSNGSSLLRDGRGGFRTCDLSRVKSDRDEEHVDRRASLHVATRWDRSATTKEDRDAEADLLDDCVAGRLHRRTRWRDRLDGARRGAVSVPHPADTGDWCASLRTAALRRDGLLGDR